MRKVNKVLFIGCVLLASIGAFGADCSHGVSTSLHGDTQTIAASGSSAVETAQGAQ